MVVDVAIVGAGMAGLHCALALRDSGLSVAVFEARLVGGQATGKSTAKVTSQHGLRYARLTHDFGRDDAQRYAAANQRVVDAICTLCAGMPDDPGLERRDAFLFAQIDDELRDLKDEAEAATALGLPVRLDGATELPIAMTGLLRFTNQA
jgi:glycine/D-amino acid oxidase-like deaminating enzyme